MDVFTRDELMELCEVLGEHVRKATHTGVTMQPGVAGFKNIAKIDRDRTQLKLALSDRPVLKLFGKELLSVYLGRRDPLLLALFTDDVDLPRCAAYDGVAAAVARWRLDTGREPRGLP